jgi:hypothetical protein
VGGSVQQGLSAASAAKAGFGVGGAADKRYSLYGIVATVSPF